MDLCEMTTGAVGRPMQMVRDWSTWHPRRWFGFFSIKKRRANLLLSTTDGSENTEGMDPDSCHRYTKKGWEATGTDWNMKNFNIDVRDKKSHAGSQTPKQVAMSSCGIPIFGSVQSLEERVPEQPDLIRPTLSRLVWFPELLCHHTLKKVIISFCATLHLYHFFIQASIPKTLLSPDTNRKSKVKFMPFVNENKREKKKAIIGFKLI